MVNIILRIFDYFQHRKLLCYGLLIAIIGLLLFMISSLKYNEDIYDFLPMDNDQQKAITLYQDITGGKRIVAMIRMKEINEINTERLSEVVETFSNKIIVNDHAKRIKEIVCQVDDEKIEGITNFVYQNIPLMLTDSDYVRMNQILSNPKLVEEQLVRDVQMVLMPASGSFATNISNDPIGLFTPIMTRLQDRQSESAFEIENGYIFTRNKQYAVVLMTSSYGSMESANNTLLVNFIDSISQQTMRIFPDVEIDITGSPVIAVDNANQIKADSRLAILIAVVLILVLLFFSFRSIGNLFLIGVSIIFGWLFAMAFIAVLRDNVSIIVLGIGSIIIGIAVNYPLHFIAHIGHGESLRDVLKDIVSPLLIGNITTVGAFASLIPLDAPALRDLGLFAAFMLIGTILFVLIFLPHLIKKQTKGGKEYLLFGRLTSISPKLNGWFAGGVFLLTIVLLYFSLNTSFDANMHHINYLKPTQKRLMADLHVSAGINDSSNVYVVTEGNSWDEALQERSRLTPLIDRLKEKQEISNYSDVTNYICSKEEQEHRIKLWNDFWEAHRFNTLKYLQTYAPQNGFADNAFNGFENIISKSYSPHSFEYFEPLVSALFGQSFSSSTGKCSVVDKIKTTENNLSKVEDVIKDTRNGHVYSFDFAGMNSAVANVLSNDFNYIGFACGCIVFIFLWLSFGRFELSLLAFLPMAVGWIWILGIMNILGMQFNIVNVILATFIFGQGDDYTIFMTDGLINEYAYKKKILPSYKNSIIISALIMFIGMGSLIVAKHPALHSLAEVTIVGMLTVVIMAWIIPPMLFNWLTCNNGRTRKSPVTVEQIVRIIYCTITYLLEIVFGCVVGTIIKILPFRKKENTLWFHRLTYKTMKLNIHHIWGVKILIHNDHNEEFNRGSIIISNHQSILDPVLMLALSPHVKILISEKVWKNPIVHSLFKLEGFINLNQPMEILKEEISKSIQNGYNVVLFPEGQRNDEKITRFHKGAFYIAQEIDADILPIYLHGVGHVMPKGSGFASRGQIDIEIGKRIPAKELCKFGATNQLIAHHFQEEYREKMAQMKERIETTHYFNPSLIDMYIYKGAGVERETRHLLKQHDDFSHWIDSYKPESDKDLAIVNAGRGQFPLLFALVHPKIQIHSFTTDIDDVALASSCSLMPPNLSIHYCPDTKESVELAKNYQIINFEDVIKSSRESS